jgi:hypothetical protein
MNGIDLLESDRLALEILFSSLVEGDVVVVPEICAALQAHLSRDGARDHQRLLDEIEALMQASCVDEGYVLRARDLVLRARRHLEHDQSAALRALNDHQTGA